MINVWNRASDSDSTHHNSNQNDSDYDSTKMNYKRFRFQLRNRSQNRPFNSDIRVGIASGLHTMMYCVFCAVFSHYVKKVTFTVVPGLAAERSDLGQDRKITIYLPGPASFRSAPGPACSISFKPGAAQPMGCRPACGPAHGPIQTHTFHSLSLCNIYHSHTVFVTYTLYTLTLCKAKYVYSVISHLKFPLL